MNSFPYLPTRFSVGTKYVLEARGRLVRRYIEFPDGRKIALPLRKALTCTCAERRTRRTSNALDNRADVVDAGMSSQRVAA